MLMKRGIFCLIIIAGILLSTNLRAQYVYDFSVAQETYTPLPNAQVLNGTNIWDDVNYKPDLGFGYELDWTPVTKFALVCNTKGLFLGTDTTSLFNGFCILDADLQDRGKVDTFSKSSIRYRTDIVGGKKVVKIELYNAGFWREKDLYGTMDDSVNLQVWLYEGTNAIELRYGPSKISHTSDYFIYGGGVGPVIGFVKDAGLFQLNLTKLYHLKGNPSIPSLDSCGTNINNVTSTLDAYPPSGTVYRFTPKPNSVKKLEPRLTNVIIQNTVCYDDIIITNNETLPLNYQVVSLSGSIINQNGSLIRGQNKIDISNLPRGIHILKLSSAEVAKTIKFVKL